MTWKRIINSIWLVVRCNPIRLSWKGLNRSQPSTPCKQGHSLVCIDVRMFVKWVPFVDCPRKGVPVSEKLYFQTLPEKLGVNISRPRTIQDLFWQWVSPGIELTTPPIYNIPVWTRKYYIYPARLPQPPNYPLKLEYLTLALQDMLRPSSALFHSTLDRILAPKSTWEISYIQRDYKKQYR